MLDIATPYLVFFGATASPTDAKTGLGLAHWRPELCVGQLRYPGCHIESGLPEMRPEHYVRPPIHEQTFVPDRYP